MDVWFADLKAAIWAGMHSWRMQRTVNPPHQKHRRFDSYSAHHMSGQLSRQSNGLKIHVALVRFRLQTPSNCSQFKKKNACRIGKSVMLPARTEQFIICRIDATGSVSPLQGGSYGFESLILYQFIRSSPNNSTRTPGLFRRQGRRRFVWIPLKII